MDSMLGQGMLRMQNARQTVQNKQNRAFEPFRRINSICKSMEKGGRHMRNKSEPEDTMLESEDDYFTKINGIMIPFNVLK